MIDYTQWSAMQPGREPYTRLSPRLKMLLNFLLWCHGGVTLTSDGVDVRPIRDGSSWSAHAFGAALDWRYGLVGGGNREVGRAKFLADVLPFLIDNADALGIQQIHDYYGSRIWRTGRGWRTNTTAAHMGESWAQYIHVEVNAPSWSDGTPIAELLGLGPVEPDPTTPTNPPFNPEAPPVTILNIEHATLRRTTVAPSTAQRRAVARVQAILAANWGAAQLAADGYFGDQTDQAVRNMQRIAHVTVDGIVGPQTATVLFSK